MVTFEVDGGLLSKWVCPHCLDGTGYGRVTVTFPPEYVEEAKKFLAGLPPADEFGWPKGLFNWLRRRP